MMPAIKHRATDYFIGLCMTKILMPTFNRISILIFLCLFLCVEGTCAAGNLQHIDKESFSSENTQRISPTPYPLLA
jgi:hypothetical protein